MQAALPLRRSLRPVLVVGTLLALAGCGKPVTDPGLDAATAVAARVRAQLMRVSDTVFRPYVEDAPAGMVLRIERGCRGIARIPLPVPTIDSLDTMGGTGDSFLDDLAIAPSACDSILRARRMLDDTLTVISIAHDSYGAADTVAATTILALHQWFHHAWFEDGYRVPERLMRRTVGSLAGSAGTEPSGLDSLRIAAREALADALGSTSRQGRLAALERYRCAREAIFAGDTVRDMLAQVRETSEGPAIIGSLRGARQLGLLSADPRAAIITALRGRLWAPPETSRAETGREFHYAVAAALTLLVEAELPGAADSLRAGARLEQLVIQRHGSCPSR